MKSMWEKKKLQNLAKNLGLEITKAKIRASKTLQAASSTNEVKKLSSFDVEYNCLQDGKNKGVTYDLEELRQIYDGSEHLVAVTINLPRVKSFRMMNSREQENFLKRIFSDAIKECSFPCNMNHFSIVETCKDGNLHLHGIFRHNMGHLENHVILSHQGVVQDYVKSIYKLFKRNIKNFKYSDKYVRCSSPMCVTQYIDNFDEFVRWYKYMMKDQGNVKIFNSDHI